MSDALKAGVIGVGLVGAPHIEAIKRTGLADVVAVAASSPESARRAAERHGVRRSVDDWRAIVEDPEIDVVHNCTPNDVHAAVGTAALAAGKHLITEKPLADTFEHAGALMTAAARSPSVTALCHNYREYAMVAQARELIADGTIGDVFQVHGVYLQDWLSERGATNWRLSPERSGPSTTFADIGTHWCDLAMHLLGRRIDAVCGVTGSLHGRTTDDHGGCLFRFAGGALGTLVSSQVSPGAKNSFQIKFDGTVGSLYWDQERPEELWLGRASRPTELLHKYPDQLHERARARAHLPAGELEGWNTTFVNLFSAVYRTILGRPLPGDECVATLADGLYLMRLIDAVIASDAERAWVDVAVDPG